jgi:hypothetical protein
MQYWLTYGLNQKPDGGNRWTVPKPQWKADQGNVVHKALELLARKKLALQNGEPTFREDEIARSWDTAAFTEEEAFEEAWGYYTEVRCPHWPWSAAEHKKCKGWMYDTLDFNGGMWNPLNRHVLDPEKYFDITFDEPWARYAYSLPDGRKFEGQLAIKGTIDLVTREDADTLTYVDWKTGMRKDWASGKIKDWKKLRDDPQLRMYHYALAKLYPEYKHIIMTIVYAQDGGAFSLDFGPADLPKTERMLRERFETIKGCERPPRIRHDPVHKWKCDRLCAFGMSNWEGTDQTVCDHMHEEVVTLGMARATAKHLRGTVGAYGEGGGRTSREGGE